MRALLLRSALRWTLALGLLASSAGLIGCGPCGVCAAGSHCNSCAHGSCPECDDCVPECVPD